MKADRKFVAITGGTRGLGRCAAQAFLAKGYHVAVIARTPPSDPPSQSEYMFIVADVTKPDSLRLAAEQIQQRWGGVDVWINNAGYGKKLPFVGPETAAWADMFNVNFWGTVNGCREALRMMLDRGQGGTIINIASLAGLMACPSHSAYCTSKAAVIALTRSLAVDFAAQGIRVNAIAPGPLDTEGFRSAGGDPQQRALSIPTRVMVSPKEIAETCLFLSEPLTSLTGQTLVIDGGSMAIGCYTEPAPPKLTK